MSSTSEETSVPPEFGGTLHFNYPYKDYVVPYGGFEIESFSSYNMDDFLNGSTLKTRSHYALYAALGAAKSFKVYKRSLLLKFGLGYRALGSDEKSATSSESYSGYKYIFFVHYNIYKKYSMNLFYKKHIFSGPTDLSISRYGFGLNYSLF